MISYLILRKGPSINYVFSKSAPNMECVFEDNSIKVKASLLRKLNFEP